MLLLERRPDEPTARARFIEARDVTTARTVQLYRRTFPQLGDDQIDQLATLTIALADGLFIAHHVDGTSLHAAFDLIATTIQATAERLAHAPG